MNDSDFHHSTSTEDLSKSKPYRDSIRHYPTMTS
uniref:Uncharacterized protein n=1 Tax=Arundo donax TaxID=35708 RepID=A0A0A9AQP4_ARUDO